MHTRPMILWLECVGNRVLDFYYDFYYEYFSYLVVILIKSISNIVHRSLKRIMQNPF